MSNVQDFPIPRATTCQFLKDEPMDPACGKPVQEESPYCPWHHIVCHIWAERRFKDWAVKAPPDELPAYDELDELVLSGRDLTISKALSEREKAAKGFSPLYTSWSILGEGSFGGVQGSAEQAFDGSSNRDFQGGRVNTSGSEYD